MKVNDVRNMKAALTHSGKFHADDVFGAAFLQIINPRLEIIRNNNVPYEFYGLVFDIGMGEFDHHMANNECRSNGHPYASFGKLWRAFAKDLYGEYIYESIDRILIEDLDLSDNTGSYNALAIAIDVFNNKDVNNNDNNFFEAMKFAKKILENDSEQYEIPLKITKPNVTMEQIGAEAFPNKISFYSTRYDGGDVNRSTNLELACEKINDVIVLPGETFSYNKTLGERSKAAGYKTAKVYENGEVVDGIGGGICQISSTLYNAVLKANLEIVERRNHQFITSYVEEGRDATVAYGVTDFKFKNSRKYAIKIKASASNGVATIEIFGIKEEVEYQISFDTKTISTIPYTVKYIDDNTLKTGTEVVKQKGANGIVTETYLIKSLNGQVVSNTLLSKDTYSAMQRIVLRGTKK